MKLRQDPTCIAITEEDEEDDEARARKHRAPEVNSSFLRLTSSRDSPTPLPPLCHPLHAAPPSQHTASTPCRSAHSAVAAALPSTSCRSALRPLPSPKLSHLSPEVATCVSPIPLAFRRSLPRSRELDSTHQAQSAAAKPGPDTRQTRAALSSVSIVVGLFRKGVLIVKYNDTLNLVDLEIF